MKIEEIIQGLKFTDEMFHFDPSTGEVKKDWQLNDQDMITVNACREAIKLLSCMEAEKKNRLFTYMDGVAAGLLHPIVDTKSLLSEIRDEIAGHRDFAHDCHDDSDLGIAIDIVDRHIKELTGDSKDI